MPWSRLRPHRSGDTGSLRRHSTVDPTLLQEHVPSSSTRPSQDVLQSTRIPSPLRKSFEPPAGDSPSPTMEQPPTLTQQEPPPRRQRFSMLRYRHASDPQISKTARDHATAPVPPMPAAPSIVTTAPTDNVDSVKKRQSTSPLSGRQKAPELPRKLSSKAFRKFLVDRGSDSGPNTGNLSSLNPSARQSRIAFDEPYKVRVLNAPPPYGDDSNSSLALPVSRLSESSRSDGSLGDHGLYATTTTTHTVSTTTTFFRLPRRKKNKGPLFPLPARIVPAQTSPQSNVTPRASLSGRLSESPSRQFPGHDSHATVLPHTFNIISENDRNRPPLPSPTRILAASTCGDSTTSAPSGRSSPVPAAAMPFSGRGRSSTKGSSRLNNDDDPGPAPSLPQSTRTSSSTTGRASLGGLFNLSKLRQNSEPQQFRHSNNHPPLPGTPVSEGSKPHSFNLSRDTIVVPERQEGDTPAKYLIRLEEAVSRGAVATVLSKSNDDFFKNVLRSYMRGFKFFGDPLDMSTRKLLMEVELPKETQQIDRVIQAFANRYHECNPGVYASPDEAYFIAFSILILHTDVFNKNNKNKMQKHDYTKNARGQGVADEILECFYDNISYTPFIHVDDDLDITGERIVAHKLKRNMFAKPSTDSLGKPSREPVDPYALILEDRLDSLRPSLKDTMNLEDHYNYLGTAQSFNLADLNKTFFKSGVLQILSSRSRPEAFMSPTTMANPAEAHPGVVDIKITKVGILWRKDMKKKKTRSPWQEWGAILTGAQLYFFRNISWIKSLMHQQDSHRKHVSMGAPVIFKPPIDQFKPDVLLSTEDAVALVDTTYKKHKNALVFVRHGGFEETFLADNEADMNDWLAKLNYASAFRTAGVRMRGLIGGNSDVQNTRAMRQMNSDNSAPSEDTASSEGTTRGGQADVELAHQIQEARRLIMTRKIGEADRILSEAGKQLEIQFRNARHLLILAPIQNKTREQIILAAGGMAAKIKWMRMEMWRTRCHRDILAMDLEEDNKTGGHRPGAEKLASPAPLATSSNEQDPRKFSSREGYLHSPRESSQRYSASRPSTQPSPSRTLNMDDVFSSVQSTASRSNHEAKGSWELPPLSFPPSTLSIQSGSTLSVGQPTQYPVAPQPSSGSVSDIGKPSDVNEIATRLATPAPSTDNHEQVLKEAGIVETDSSPAPKSKRPETPDVMERNIEKAKSLDPEFSDGKTKVRRSLHRTLRESAHVPSHHRSKKGKDSAGSNAEDSSSVAESEGLARGTGSFTVHGKKASVITFGSEWQNMSPDERLNMRKQAQNDGSKLAVPSAIEDEDAFGRTLSNAMIRPVSSVSASTSTSMSAAFEETVEEQEQSADTRSDGN